MQVQSLAKHGLRGLAGHEFYARTVPHLKQLEVGALERIVDRRRFADDLPGIIIPYLLFAFFKGGYGDAYVMQAHALSLYDYPGVLVKTDGARRCAEILRVGFRAFEEDRARQGVGFIGKSDAVDRGRRITHEAQVAYPAVATNDAIGGDVIVITYNDFMADQSPAPEEIARSNACERFYDDAGHQNVTGAHLDASRNVGAGADVIRDVVTVPLEAKKNSLACPHVPVSDGGDDSRRTANG
jgi:hypothetical protein